MNKLPDIFKIYFSNHRQGLLFLLVFLINLLLVSPSLMPELASVNPDDEAKYVDSGWRLLRGDIRDLAWGPIVAFVYAPIHLVVGGSLDWFLLEVWIGGFLLYTFMWWTVFYLALQLKEYISPYIMLGVLFLSIPYQNLLKFQSDVVFTGFSALALAYLIKFYFRKELKNLAISSCLVGLGILARIETAILLGILTISGLVIGWRVIPKYKILGAVILPTSCVLGSFFVSSLIFTGSIKLGTNDKAYESFEFDQVVVTGGDIENAKLETRRLFGTREENKGSMIRAILRNPLAYAMRIIANAKTVPVFYLYFFGKRLSIVLLIFAAFGGYVLLRKKSRMLLVILLFWGLHAAIHMGFLAIHIVPQVWFFLLILGAVGITSVFGFDLRAGERLIFLLINLFALGLSWFTHKPAFLFGFLMLVFVLIIDWLTQANKKIEYPIRQVPVLCLLAAGLILEGTFRFPNYPTLGKTEEEQTVHYLQQDLAFQTMILVPTPLPALAAKMDYFIYSEIPPAITSIPEFYNWLKQEDVKLIYLDSRRRIQNGLYDLFETGYANYFERSFISEDENIRIFLVK
jgi:hypothetical protein